MIGYYKITASKSRKVEYPEKDFYNVHIAYYVFFACGKENAKDTIHQIVEQGYNLESIKMITKEQYDKQDVKA